MQAHMACTDLWGNWTVELLTLTVNRPKFLTCQKSIRSRCGQIVESAVNQLDIQSTLILQIKNGTQLG